GLAGVVLQSGRADPHSPADGPLPRHRHRPAAVDHGPGERSRVDEPRHDRDRARAAAPAQDPARPGQRLPDPQPDRHPRDAAADHGHVQVPAGRDRGGEPAGRGHRDHEHHAGVGHRAHPRDRRPQGARCHAVQHHVPVPGRGAGAVPGGRPDWRAHRLVRRGGPIAAGALEHLDFAARHSARLRLQRRGRAVLRHLACPPGRAATLTGFSQYRPVDGRPAEDSTAVLVWYAPDAIYFGIRAFERHGNAVRATLADRDNIDADDHVAILLDTYLDHRRATMFAVNPLGVQEDGVWSDGIAAGAAGGPSAGGRFDATIDLNPDYVYESR